MWNIIKKEANKHMLTGWDTNYIYFNHQHIRLVGSYKFYVIKYDKIFKDVSYNVLVKYKNIF